MQLTKENSAAFLNAILEGEPCTVSSIAKELKCNKSYISAVKRAVSAFSFNKFQ